MFQASDGKPSEVPRMGFYEAARLTLSDRNPLDDVPRHLLLPAVVKRRRSRLRVPSEFVSIIVSQKWLRRNASMLQLACIVPAAGYSSDKAG
jgi:hypothetical protein